MLDYNLIINASTSVSRGVCLSDRTQLIIVTAMSFIESRDVWNEMTESQWDSLDGDIGEVYAQLLDFGSCIGGGGMNNQIVNVTFGGTEFNTLSQSYVNVSDDISVTINCSGSGGFIQIVASFVGFKNTTGSGYFRLSDGTTNLSEFQITSAIASPLTIVALFDNNIQGSRTFRLQYRSSSNNLVRVLNVNGYINALEVY